MAKRNFNIIVIGTTGCGKSSTCNFISGENVFKSGVSLKSVTKEVYLKETLHDGRTIKVVDTPGIFGTHQNVFETALKIQTSLKVVSPGPHVFLIVIDASKRYTDEAQTTQHIIQLTFGEKIFEHALIIFTHEDKLQSSEEFFREAEDVPELQSLIQLCGGRCITLNNCSVDETYRTRKLKNIIEYVTDISKEGKTCFTKDVTIYKKALKKLASEKIATKDLKLEMIKAIISEIKREANRKLKIAVCVATVGTAVLTGVAIISANPGLVGNCVTTGVKISSAIPNTVLNPVHPVRQGLYFCL